nr:MAG: 3-beta hydroxysteroid dehydrogenase [Bacteroidota bacterium]
MILITGFPGFLGTHLVRSLAASGRAGELKLLVQPRYRALARATMARIGLENADLVEGDITEPDLGLGDPPWRKQIREIFHLAAVYDLRIRREQGWRVNVEGTEHVLRWAGRCPRLDRFHYVSTAYVSGRRKGLIREQELEHEAGFKNAYEETKYWAEVRVRAWRDRLPVTIYRPAIVVGSSQNGETEKFDGPYYVLRAMLRMPRYGVLFRVGSGRHPVNIVPVDYVVRALLALGQKPESAGKTYHLVDPYPLTVREVIALFARLLDRRFLYIPVSARMARALLRTPLGRWLGLAPELVDYFDFPAYYDATQALGDLADTGIRCPPLPEYAPRLVAFLRAHLGRVRDGALY